MHHITDSHEWEIYSKGHTHISLPLPVILYNIEHGLSVFMFSVFEHGHANYNGYYLDKKHHIQSLDGSAFYDLSITKNVLAMLVSSLILFLLFRSVAKRYQANPLQAPSGMQNLFEVLIIFVRDEIVKPMLKENTYRFLPYLLTVFFFIWINNLLGLLPSAANVTGNIAVTVTLALFTFFITMFNSSGHYWHHLLTAPGVPMGVKPILILVEVLSIFTKPFALLIRLFANMTAGHLIVLSFLSLIFIFGEMSAIAGYGISLFSLAFSVFIYCLELLVAVLQAYIFTNLSALFISEVLPHDNHHGEHAH
jgi:F-type H+-transporting ATPase subunit a